jgi:hypothetical protein
VSTASLNFLIHSSAFTHLFGHSKLNGFVTIQTVKIHIHFAILAMTGAAQVQVPHHIQHVINTISVSCNAALISCSLSSAAFLPISGLAQAHNHLVRFNQIFILLSHKVTAKS